MTAQENALLRGNTGWSWPIDLTSYDRSPDLTEAERQELALMAARSGGPGSNGGEPGLASPVLDRLFAPLIDIDQHIHTSYTEGTNQKRQTSTIRAFVREMHRRQTAFWAWSQEDWREFINACVILRRHNCLANAC